MIIATYNIWNSNVGIPLRNAQINNEIIKINADFLCLQEVNSKSYHKEVANACNYKYSCFFHHANAEEGLSILSRFPIENCYYTSYAIIATINFENSTILFANMHLPWDSAIKREESIINIVNETTKIKCDYYFILGDFNCSENSSVQRFLLGESSLINAEANPYWYDLASAYAELSNTPLDPTLNFRENPRWKGKNSIETNQRFDRILMKNTYPNEFPKLEKVFVFGKDVSKSGYCASDHYGVCAELKFTL